MAKDKSFLVSVKDGEGRHVESVIITSNHTSEQIDEKLNKVLERNPNRSNLKRTLSVLKIACAIILGRYDKDCKKKTK